MRTISISHRINGIWILNLALDRYHPITRCESWFRFTPSRPTEDGKTSQQKGFLIIPSSNWKLSRSKSHQIVMTHNSCSGTDARSSNPCHPTPLLRQIVNLYMWMMCKTNWIKIKMTFPKASGFVGALRCSIPLEVIGSIPALPM